jgi:hypothetical protein
MANSPILVAKDSLERLWLHTQAHLNEKADKKAVKEQLQNISLDDIKNKPNEDDALELISEMGLVEPVLSEDGFVFVDETGAIYSIL